MGSDSTLTLILAVGLGGAAIYLMQQKGGLGALLGGSAASEAAPVPAAAPPQAPQQQAAAEIPVPQQQIYTFDQPGGLDPIPQIYYLLQQQAYPLGIYYTYDDILALIEYYYYGDLQVVFSLRDSAAINRIYRRIVERMLRDLRDPVRINWTRLRSRLSGQHHRFPWRHDDSHDRDHDHDDHRRPGPPPGGHDGRWDNHPRPFKEGDKDRKPPRNSDFTPPPVAAPPPPPPHIPPPPVTTPVPPTPAAPMPKPPMPPVPVPSPTTPGGTPADDDGRDDDDVDTKPNPAPKPGDPVIVHKPAPARPWKPAKVKAARAGWSYDF